MASAPPQPQFCAWCGSPLAYERHEHEPRFATLADQARAGGEEPPPLPERVEELLRGDCYVGACPGCRILSHVISHHAAD
ncbi:MAG: hypothetical protein H0T43_02990 [Solirubrobacterales bacterium]|nr:hypothetical protein [Solirubrobacterales bacterium]